MKVNSRFAPALRLLPLSLAAILLACLVPALAAEPAAAGCGGVKTAKATRTVNPGGKAPLAVGDSTMLLALPDLARAGYNANARGCRMWAEGLGVLRKAKRQGRLPHMVLIALGADWKVTRADIRKALSILGRKRVLTLMTPLESGGWSGRDARNMRWAFRKHTRRIVLLDWVKYSRGHGSWFQPDALHLTFPGARAFARLSRRALPYARAGQFPNRFRFPG